MYLCAYKPKVTIVDLVQEKSTQQRQMKLGAVQLQEEAMKKGAWSSDEDAKLVKTVEMYGQGRWNSLAQAAGLHRTGKSCRLRWKNHLQPNVRHGNFTLEEQLLILQLHFRWGNKWAKIAEELPGRTDNDIKNYWRTRILKQAKHLNCDVNSPQFKHAISHVWIPQLIQRIMSGSGSGSESESGSYMGQARMPVNSPQDVSGPDPNDSVEIKLPSTGPDANSCTEKPNIEYGSTGSWDPMGIQQRMPVNSPQDVSGPDPNNSVEIKLPASGPDANPCTEMPNIEYGSIGSWDPVGIQQAQNGSDGMGTAGPGFGPLVFESSPSTWGTCEFELDFTLDVCDYSSTINYSAEEDMFDWEIQPFNLA